MLRLLASRNQPSAYDGRLLSAVISFAVALGTAVAFLPLAVNLSRNTTRAGIVAFTYVLVVVTAGITALLLRIFLQPAEFYDDRVAPIASIASIMLWTVPAVLFLLNGGLLGLLLFSVFTAVVGKRLLQVSGSKLHDSLTAEPIHLPEYILGADLINARTHTARLVLLTGIVSLAYIGIAVELAGYKVLAAVCIVAGCSIYACVFRCSRVLERTSRKRNIFKMLAHAAFAIGASFFLLVSLNQDSGAIPIRTATAGRQNHGSSSSGRYSSIILFNEKKAVSLVVPPTTRSRIGPELKLSRIMNIPFSGEYWFFRSPLLRPLPDSMKLEGDPTVFSINVRGLGALQMQARQSLGQPISTHCCRAINLVLRSRDPKPDHVLVELILIDSSRRARYSQTLGERSLARPNGGVAATQDAASNETFEFDVPRRSQIKFFDTLEVWFHLTRERAGQSAIVSVESFELVP